jgi:hypothetical protein
MSATTYGDKLKQIHRLERAFMQAETRLEHAEAVVTTEKANVRTAIDMLNRAVAEAKVMSEGASA